MSAHTVKIFSIHGKDFLDVEEAAHYMCISVSQFRVIAKEHGLLPIKSFGKHIYRKRDLFELISSQDD